MTKASLRRTLRARRAAVDQATWANLSEQITQRLSQLPDLLQAEQILVYMALEREVNLDTLLTLFPEKTWGIPRCVDSELAWHGFDPTRLCPGPYGIREPDPTSPTLDPTASPLILVPTLGCDTRGYRLGYGGGYYDRFLARCPGPTTLGVMTSHGWLTDLPVDPWDQPLDGVITEAGLCWFRA